MRKVTRIFFNALPMIFMIVLIPLVQNDYLLTLLYVILIVILFSTTREYNDGIVFVFGFFIMIAAEMAFISTGVEVFKRHSLFGMMPVWLPFLWAYGFVAIKHSIEILDNR